MNFLSKMLHSVIPSMFLTAIVLGTIGAVGYIRGDELLRAPELSTLLTTWFLLTLYVALTIEDEDEK